MKNSLLFRFLIVPIELLVVFISLWAVYFLRKSNYLLDSNVFIVDKKEFLIITIILALFFQIILFFNGTYSLHREFSFFKDVSKIFTTSVIWILTIASYFFWTRDYFFSRFILLASFILIIIALILTRAIFNIVKKHILKKEKMFILGNDEDVIPLKKYFQRTGVYTVENKNTWTANEGIDVFVLQNQVITKEIEEYINYCIIHHIRVFINSPSLFRRKEDLKIRGLQVYEIFETTLYGWQRVLKRIFDIVFASVMLIILFPLNLIIAIIIKLNSKGPAIVALTRVCRGNKTFKLYKFRSMVNNAEVLKKDLMQKNERKDGPLFKMKHDPRITKIGGFIRKTRIDEIPQFWNVLKGDMSVVGPRPHEPAEVEKYKEEQKKLLMIKPGLTGMAQVSGASDLSFQEEVALDMSYVQNWNIFLDLWIILKTVVVVISKKGAA